MLWAVLAAAAGALATGAAAALAEATLPLAGESLTRIAVAASVLLALWGLAGLVVSAFTRGALACLLVDLTARVEGADALRAPVSTRRGMSVAMAAALAVAAALSASGGVAALHLAAEEGRVQVIAHRGAAQDRPENTLAAFEKAFEDGADWIELDVQETADGEVVVIHDSDFLKVGGDPLKVWNATMEDVARIDVGSRFDPSYADQRAPTLRAALDVAKGRGRVLIELKHYGHAVRLEERVARIVDEAGMEDAVAAMSLDAASARRA